MVSKKGSGRPSVVTHLLLVSPCHLTDDCYIVLRLGEGATGRYRESWDQPVRSLVPLL